MIYCEPYHYCTCFKSLDSSVLRHSAHLIEFRCSLSGAGGHIYSPHKLGCTSFRHTSYTVYNHWRIAVPAGG